MDLTLLRAQYRFLIGMPEDPEKLVEAMCEWVEKCTTHNHELKKEVEDLEEQLETAACEAEQSLDSLVEGLQQLLKGYV